MRLKTFGATAAAAPAKGAAAAAAKPPSQSVSISKLLSLATPGEKCLLYVAWVCSLLTGLVLPSFIFLMGPVFDSFGPD